MRICVFSLVVASALVGCSGVDQDPDRVESRTDPIVNGSLDTTHQAVVSLVSNQSLCTATIIEVNGNMGYALTAAHCVADAPEWVVQGDDFQTSNIFYPVEDYQADPSYNGDDHDFGMVRFSGAGPSTPVIPAMTEAEDNLAVGTNLDEIGFGDTGSGNNSKRRHITHPIDEVHPLTIVFDQSDGGTCFGDSGGPAITVADPIRVAGVTSWGTDPSCQGGFSVDGRVSAVYDSFIRPFIDGGPIEQTCDQCLNAATSGVGDCSGEVQDCFDNPDCSDLVDCGNACSSDACFAQCLADHPDGADIYTQIFACVCNEACVTECADEPTCNSTDASCGFTAEDPTCETCFEANCCAEASACAEDDACSACLTESPTPAGCDTNALIDAFSACLGTHCSTECGVSNGTTSSSSGDMTSTGTGTTTGAQTGVGGAAAATGATSGGEGGAGGGEDKNLKSGDAVSDEGCGCRIPSNGEPSSAWYLGILGLALAKLRRQKRSRN